MRLHELTPFAEERKQRKRVGRGPSSGTGGTSGKGHKGANARSGGGPKPGFEGGQMPLRRRLPKRGFKNPTRVEYQPINLSQIEEVFSDRTEITLEDLYESGLCKRANPVKILAGGEISRSLKIEAHKFSKTALDKIQKAGGEAVILEGAQ